MSTPEPSDQQLEKRRQFLEKLLSTGYDKAATFTQILIGAGYAGFFAIWNWVNPYLSRWQTLTTAALLGTSLLLFMLWQLYQMVVIGLLQMRFGKLVSTPNADFDAAVETHQRASIQTQARLAKLWIPALTAITVPGAFGAILLIVACVRHVVSDP